MTRYWDGHARGAYMGLSGLHGRAHMCRAILEWLVLKERLLVNGVEAAISRSIDEIILLGAGSRRLLLCRVIANVLGRSVKLAREQETTALGAGIHAAAACGLYKDIREAADAMTGVEKSFEPGAKSVERDADNSEAYRSVYPELKNTVRLMAEKMQ